MRRALDGNFVLFRLVQNLKLPSASHLLQKPPFCVAALFFKGAPDKIPFHLGETPL
jgi:hypothetical protein